MCNRSAAVIFTLAMLPLVINVLTNNSDGAKSARSARGDGSEELITSQQYETFMKAFLIVYPVLGLTGIVSNCTNIYVFAKLGLTDIMTITLFSLSVADLGVTVFSTMAGLSYGFIQVQSEFGVWFMVNPFVVVVFATNTMKSIQGGSIMLTAFLAVQRCCCVALPFGFRQLFTRSFVTYVIAGIAAVTTFFVAAFGSLYTGQWKRAPGTNLSVLQIAKRAHRDVLHHYLVLIRLFALTIGCQAIVLVCLVVMLRGLRKSAGFKHRAAARAHMDRRMADEEPSNLTSPSTKTRFYSGGDEKDKETYEKEESSASEVSVPASSAGASLSPQQLSELRLMKTVILLSILFVTCNSPSIIHAFLRLVLPGFDTFGRLGNSYKVSINIADLFEILSANLNVLIYLKSNTRFRGTMKACLKATDV